MVVIDLLLLIINKIRLVSRLFSPLPSQYWSCSSSIVWSAPGTYPEEEEEERIGAPRSSSHPPVPSKSSQQQNVQRGPTSVGTTEGGGYHTLE